MPISTEAHLTRVKAQARDNIYEADRLVQGLGRDELLWRPAPDRWGVADCFEHLFSTGAAYHPRIRSALASAPPGDPSAVYRRTFFGRAFLYFAGPEGRVRIRARELFAPGPSRPDAPERFQDQQEELLDLIEEARGVDLRRTRVTSPLSRLLTLTLGECLEMLVQHQRRHLYQARRVIKEAGGRPPEVPE